MNNFTSDMAAKSKKFISNSILRLYKQKMMLKLMGIDSNEPKLTQKEISKQLGFSDSVVEKENNFRYEETQMNGNILKQVIE